jgi:aspartyl-tRNA(Asn)/glutamyl-tRNA(Gln) amidotransferase subunit C
MPITEKDIRYVADLSRLELDAGEEKLYGEQLGRILAYVDELQSVNVEGVEPCISAAAAGNVFREDAVQPSLAPEEATRNAPEEENGGFIVPRVVEG